MKKYTHKLAAAATVGMVVATSGEAFAGTTQTWKDISGNITTSTSSFNGLISALCFLGGMGMGVAGIFKLKQHVDNPGQTPMKDGLMRLGAGGALLAFPFVTTAMQGAINNGDSSRVAAGSLTLDNTQIFT